MVLDDGHSQFSVTELSCCRNAGNGQSPSNASGASSSRFFDVKMPTRPSVSRIAQ